MTEFDNEGERLLFDEMVRSRNAGLPKPPSMQSHRYTRVKKAARRRIGELPAVDAAGRPPLYHAARRLSHTPVGRFAIHQTLDGQLPICALADHFAGATDQIELGPGPVTCGHCARVAR